MSGVAPFRFPAERVSVAVDARGLNASGIGRYTREILSVLLSDERFRRVILLGHPGDLGRFAADRRTHAEVEVVEYRGGFYSPRAQWEWLRHRVDARAHVTFFPHYDAPLFGLPRRSVVTVHDLTHFKVPEAFIAWRRAAAAVLLAQAMRGAKRVITGSQAARSDLADRFPSALAKVDVVAHGVSPCFRPVNCGYETDSAEVDALRPFLLCVGNRKPHKNLVAAVETLAILRPVRPQLRLVFAGRAYVGWDSVLRRAEALGVRDRVTELNDVEDNTLRLLYARCEALLFPSLYEGFGLPVLEAMACGAPVIASNRASIPEVVGDAGVLIDPHDHQGMADAVLRLEREPDFRSFLTGRGRARAAEFTWERAACRTADILYEVGAVGAGEPV